MNADTAIHQESSRAERSELSVLWPGSVREYAQVTSRLERLPRDWARSREEWLRQANVQALGEFKSGANVAILKGMLDDQAWRIEHKDNVKERVYHIRETAYRTLREWGISVPSPAMREPENSKE